MFNFGLGVGNNAFLLLSTFIYIWFWVCILNFASSFKILLMAVVYLGCCHTKDSRIVDIHSLSTIFYNATNKDLNKDSGPSIRSISMTIIVIRAFSHFSDILAWGGRTWAKMPLKIEFLDPQQYICF